jgi:ketosteroid isomerase-like protein
MASVGTSSAELAPEVLQLLDEAAIRRVHLDYCRGIDRRDWDLVASCYHADAIDYHGPFVGGVKEFIEWGTEALAAVETTTHFVGNQLIDVDGDVARHEAYVLAFHRIKGDRDNPAVDWVVNVRYLDRMERRDGEWKIADRLVIHDSDRRDFVAGSGALSPGWLRGGPSPEDPSYSRAATWAEYLAARRPGD